MSDIESIKSRAKEARLLDQRIAENVSSQDIDLAAWISERISVRRGSHILELCCGTGAQTTFLLEATGSTGQVVAIDISREALDTLALRFNANPMTNLSLIEADLDGFEEALSGGGFQPPFFDNVFCAYGLYYSTNAGEALRIAKRWLSPEGSICIVGPFGQNNHQLFDLLEKSGVDIAPYVRYTSQEFMWKVVVPWATNNFQSVVINTIVNRVKWDSPDKLLNYWKNSTFFDPQKESIVQERAQAHFKHDSVFTNEKWIMMLEMFNARK